MHEVVRTLRAGEPVGVLAWHGFWDALAHPGSGPDAVALLETLDRGVPDHGTVGALVASLDARRTRPPARPAVNIVGSGGGPPTFNLSTAAAILAAAIGVPVVKSGSRAYTSRFGAHDALALLGVPVAGSDDEVADSLDRAGIAFPGGFVYPLEVALLARRTFPLDWRTVASWVNRLGPFLAAVPADAQFTGLSDQRLLGLYEHLAARAPQRVWLCVNASGVDELVSFEDNRLFAGGAWRPLSPRALGAAPGTLADLAGARAPEAAARQLVSVLGGEGPPAALDSLCLNAACLAVITGVEPDWGEALREARRALAAGAALATLDRVRGHVPVG